ncbi:hypothetical protein CERSUDRAFT_104821 [Gelatoporia subvermispora B]|uniref:Indoleamine 2,3-dioxygenase n=1 Tax=Ceriporiopsis subvermispora (strain B) TaxID=914234 RepID=M2PP27_CERS8|nr:hypothetical protein CERSUDRAFT_104821 [Gelatoporia subvermispora B]
MALVISPIHTISRVLPRLSVANDDEPEEFDVHPQSGFFPPQPLQKLPEAFGIWEQLLADAHSCLTLSNDYSEEAVAKRPKGELWRNRVRDMPLISIVNLTENSQLQRAHMVLAWILHFFIHSMPQSEKEPQVRIPQSLAVPLVEVSKILRIAPVATFADVVLWNYELIDPTLPLTPQNIKYDNLFSGTETERQFYVVSALVEMKGVEMLKIFEDFYNLQDPTTPSAVEKIAVDLVQLKKIVDELTEIFRLIRTTLDPNIFYWKARPWWSGAKNTLKKMEWVFEGIPDSAVLDIGGGSAGQSSVMHALDIFLDIDHKLETKRSPPPSERNLQSELGFMERMRRYMPGKHREYLEHMASVRPTVRDVAQNVSTLVVRFDEAVLALKKLRDLHIRVVTLYVVNQTRSTPSAGLVSEVQNEGPARGTGGSSVSILLKAGRDATARSVLQ